MHWQQRDTLKKCQVSLSGLNIIKSKLDPLPFSCMLSACLRLSLSNSWKSWFYDYVEHVFVLYSYCGSLNFGVVIRDDVFLEEKMCPDSLMTVSSVESNWMKISLIKSSGLESLLMVMKFIRWGSSWVTIFSFFVIDISVYFSIQILLSSFIGFKSSFKHYGSL